MDLNNISFTFEQLFNASWFAWILFLILLIVLLVPIFSFAKHALKYKDKVSGFIGAGFGVGLVAAIIFGFFNFDLILNSQKSYLAAGVVISSVEETYGATLDSPDTQAVSSSIKNSLNKFYNNGSDVPEVISLNILGSEWQSDRFTIKTDRGLSTVYLANDTDGKTYLWVDKPASKEKFVK